LFQVWIRHQCAPRASVVAATIEHVPVPAARPASVAVYHRRMRGVPDGS
jgi:hypothetical protein